MIKGKTVCRSIITIKRSTKKDMRSLSATEETKSNEQEIDGEASNRH
jgi:hypothetical protein